MYQCFIIQVKLYIINNNDNNSKSILHSWKDDKYLSSDYFIIPPLLRPTVIDLRLKISYQNITTIEKKKVHSIILGNEQTSEKQISMERILLGHSEYFTHSHEISVRAN